MKYEYRMDFVSDDSSDIEVVSVTVNPTVTRQVPKPSNFKEFVKLEISNSQGNITAESVKSALEKYDVIASDEQIADMIPLGLSVDSLLERCRIKLPKK